MNAGCPTNTRLIGTGILCPGETALYRCTTTGLSRHSWGVGNFTVQFPMTDTEGDSITDIPGATGYLVERTGELNQLGDRTTVLFYTPDTGAPSGDISIICSGAGAQGDCRLVTRFIGMVFCVMHTSGSNIFLFTYTGNAL